MRLRLAALALVLPLAACGGSTPAEVTLSAVEVVRAAGTKTAEAGTARVAMTMAGTGFSMTSGGASSLDDLEAEMTTTIEAGGQRAETETRLLDGVMYLKMPGLPGGKPWVKLDLDQLSAGGANIGALARVRQNDPTQALSYFAGVSDDIREDGKEDVRGTATTRYRGTFDLRKAAGAQTDAEAKKAVETVIESIGTATFPATVWIDGEGRMRKMVYEFDAAKLKTAPGLSGTLTTTFEMYDFGVRVDVNPPPAEDTADAAKVFSGKS